MDTAINIAIEDVMTAARAGGQVIKEYFGQALRTEQKSNLGDLRTKADTESEQAILGVLQRSFPNFNMYAEESGQVDNQSDYTFVIDPLDGTNNFVLGIPDFAISIGLLHLDEAILGVIYNPILDQMYSAVRGKGAFLDGVKIHVNDDADMTHASVSYTCGYNTARHYTETVVGHLRDIPVKRILDHWAPAYDYCLLASGRIEVVISKEGDLEDYVAAKVIVIEAGGIVTDFHGAPADGRGTDFVASNGTTIHGQILKLLA